MTAAAVLAAHGLPRRWQGRACYTLLADGVGSGGAFLALWRAWRDDPWRCENLVVIAIEPQPPSAAALAAASEAIGWPEGARALHMAWPPLMPGLHRLAFDAGRVELLLAIGARSAWLPELAGRVDAFELGDAAINVRTAKALARLAGADATLAAGPADAAQRAALTSAGFVDASNDDAAAAPRTHARHAPPFHSRHVRAPRPTPADRHALIVGGGLAGCATAWALAERGWRSTLIERHGHIAAEASGNPAGLFHGIVHAPDGVHARLHRAAALAAHAAVRVAMDTHRVAGGVDGLLRLESRRDLAQMQTLLHRAGLPPTFVQALSADAAAARAGLPLPHPAWLFPGGGWVDPAGLARAYLERAGARVTRRHGAAVQRVQAAPGGWQVFDADDHCLGEAPVLVLANAGDALRLLGDPGWPIERVRGQISLTNAAASDLALPALPIAGSGYLLPVIGGELMFGATAHPGDADPALRIDDHRANLARLEGLIGQRVDLRAEALRGRTAWRWSSRDRLPVIGAVPDAKPAPGARLDQPRLVPRVSGLFVFIALGSRGIGWSALGAQVLAARIASMPVALEARLIDAIDPARFVSRQARRAAAPGAER